MLLRSKKCYNKQKNKKEENYESCFICYKEDKHVTHVENIITETPVGSSYIDYACADCLCNYHVHKQCLETWFHTTKNHSCAICSRRFIWIQRTTAIKCLTDPPSHEKFKTKMKKDIQTRVEREKVIRAEQKIKDELEKKKKERIDFIIQIGIFIGKILLNFAKHLGIFSIFYISTLIFWYISKNLLFSSIITSYLYVGYYNPQLLRIIIR
jgi:hypothetical protein